MCVRTANFVRATPVSRIEFGPTAKPLPSQGNQHLKKASPYLSVAAAVFSVAVFAATAVAQTPPSTPPSQPEGAGGMQHHKMPAPTNLQVLPKDLTGEQVHQIMHKWSSALGTHCDTCHAANPNAAATPGGGAEAGPGHHHPDLDYALDTKPEKSTARLMFKMTQDINSNYLSKIKNSGVAVSCGTCHRGHLSPPLFFPPPEHHGPPPPAATPPAPGE
jgi:Photosynthetic reaction centre cytochrome C subunit